MHAQIVHWRTRLAPVRHLHKEPIGKAAAVGPLGFDHRLHAGAEMHRGEKMQGVNWIHRFRGEMRSSSPRASSVST